MGNIKSLSGKKLISILLSIDFTVIRVKGSHHFLKHDDGRITVVPVHKNENIGIGLMQKILKDIEMNKSDFEKLF